MNSSALEATIATLQQELADTEAQADKLRTAIATVRGLLPATDAAAVVPPPNGNGARMQLREVIVEVVRSNHGAGEFGLKDLYPPLAAKGFISQNSIRQVVYQLAQSGVFAVTPGATRWDPSTYRLTNKPLPRRPA